MRILSFLALLGLAFLLDHTRVWAGGEPTLTPTPVLLPSPPPPESGPDEVGPVLMEGSFAAGVSGSDPFDHRNHTPHAYLNGGVRFLVYDLVRGKAWATMPNAFHPTQFEIEADAGFLLFQLHDFTYQKNSIYGDQTRIMVGLGEGKALPHGLGYVSASLGVLMDRFQRQDEALSRMTGAYVGGNLELHVEKFHGDVKVAYYMTPRVAHEGETLTVDDVLNVTDFATWKRGVMASGRFYYEAFYLSELAIGPELQVQFNQMPDGTEFSVRLGISGRIGILR